LQALVHSKSCEGVQAHIPSKQGGIPDGGFELRVRVAKLEPITLEAWVQEGGSSKPFVTPEEEQAEKARVMARLAYLHPKGALLAELNRKKAQAESAAASSAGSLLYFKGTGKGKSVKRAKSRSKPGSGGGRRR